MKLFKRNGFWYLDYVENGVRLKRSTKTKNKKLAEQLMKEKQKELLLGIYIKQEILISDHIDQFEETIKAKYKQRSARRYCEVMEHIRDFFDEAPVNYVGEVTRKEIELYISARKNRGLTPVTNNYELGRMQQLWDYAIDIGAAVENPVKKTPKLKEPPQKPPRFLTREEIPLFLEKLRIVDPAAAYIAQFIILT